MKYVSLRPSDTDNTYEPMYDHTLDTSDIGDDVITTTPMPDLDGLVHHQQGHVVARLDQPAESAFFSGLHRHANIAMP